MGLKDKEDLIEHFLYQKDKNEQKKMLKSLPVLPAIDELQKTLYKATFIIESNISFLVGIFFLEIYSEI